MFTSIPLSPLIVREIVTSLPFVIGSSILCSNQYFLYEGEEETTLSKTIKAAGVTALGFGSTLIKKLLVASQPTPPKIILTKIS